MITDPFFMFVLNKQLPIKNLEIPEFEFYGAGMIFYVEVGPKVSCLSEAKRSIT